MAFQLDSNVYSKQKSLSDYIAVKEARDLQRAQAEQTMAASDMAIEAARQKKEMEAVGMGLAGATEADYPARRQALLKQGVPEQFLPERYNPALIDAIMTKTGYKPEAGTTPASIQEYSFYNKLQPSEQEKYLNVKRAQQVINLGGSQVVRSPTGGVAETYEVTPKPEQMPDFKGDQAAATAAGTARGAAEGALEKKILQAPQVEQLLQQAEKLLPKATSGGAATMARDVAGFFNQTTEGAEYDSQLDVVGAALTAGVPRMEGPQSNYDVALYQKAAGDLANSKTPTPVRIAAIKTIRELNNKYANMAPQQKPQANTAAGQATQKTIVKTQTSPSTGKKRIIYSDGSEEIIDAKQ